MTRTFEYLIIIINFAFLCIVFLLYCYSLSGVATLPCGGKNENDMIEDSYRDSYTGPGSLGDNFLSDLIKIKLANRS